MIIGIGTDILSYKRIEAVYKRQGAKLINRILTKFEIDELKKSPKKDIVAYLAKRFAAKEAISKALGIGIGGELSFQDIEITHNKKGKPLAKVKKFNELNIHISLSDEKKGCVIAFAVAEKSSLDN
ncbi:MAG TPA: holo-ACP synthase [Alphaproteobacteria bacterium]|nr:holo-ACP synthase [Alphaproteobacteria bacterium]